MGLEEGWDEGFERKEFDPMRKQIRNFKSRSFEKMITNYLADAYPFTSTHLCPMDSSSITLWTCPLPIESVSG